jgi:catechol 2,3-dioxygenase-like lactoylglutathione lyase family enzyme
MASIESVTLEVADPTAVNRFYTAAFGLGTQVRLRASEAPTTGFRGFTLSLTVSQPATANGLFGTALDAGASPLKPFAKSFWGYGGVVRAPDGTIWKVATSAKKDTAPATRQIDQIVLLLGVADVAASKRFYVDRGDLSVTEACFAVGCSSLGTFSTRFTELAGMPPSTYRRHAARATAGMPPCVAKQVTRPIRNREAPVTEPQLA